MKRKNPQEEKETRLPSLLVMETVSVPLTNRQGLIPEHVFLHLSVMFSKRTKRLKEFLPKIIRKLL